MSTGETAARAPVRIQRKRSKGWRMPDGAVYVGRPTRWGNPWRVGEWSSTLGRTMDVTDAVARFSREHAVGGTRAWMNREWREQLSGKDLVCWCPLDQPCHADVLLEIANSGEAGR